MPLENLGILNALNDLIKEQDVRLFGRVAHFFNIADVRNAPPMALMRCVLRAKAMSI